MSLLGYDASIPPNAPYPNSKIVAGYLGGRTPHVWTLEQWNLANGNGHLRSLGIYVIEDDAATPVSVADEMAILAHDLGWREHAPILRYVCLDSENPGNPEFAATAGPYIRHVSDSLLLAGYQLLDYRSVDALLASPSGCHEWIAHWDVPPGPFTNRNVGFQFCPDVPFQDTQVDLSAWDLHAYEHMGRGLRRNV